MATAFPEANYRTFGTVLTDTAETVVYTCPAGAAGAMVVWLRISDDAADARAPTVSWRDDSAAVTYTLGFQVAVSANQQLSEELYLALDPSDTLRVASASGVHVTVTAIEIARPTSGRGR